MTPSNPFADIVREAVAVFSNNAIPGEWIEPDTIPPIFRYIEDAWAVGDRAEVAGRMGEVIAIFVEHAAKRSGMEIANMPMIRAALLNKSLRRIDELFAEMAEEHPEVSFLVGARTPSVEAMILAHAITTLIYALDEIGAIETKPIQSQEATQ